MGRSVRLALLVLGGLPVLAWGLDYQDYTGWTTLKARLGASAPTGSGIPVAHIEGTDGAGNYAPQPTHPEFAGKIITLKSGPSGTSSHATTVGRYYYGTSTSIASAVNGIDSYSAGFWIGSGFLQTGSAFAPSIETRRTQNHSYITLTGNPDDAEILRRLDLVVHRDGVVVAVGVNNGAGTTMPTLLSSAYNVLAVGLSNAQSSYGPVQTPIPPNTMDGPGRIKPNLVVPVDSFVTLTSWATPVVAASGAVLSQTQDSLNILSSLSSTERPVAKCLLARTLLMGGCVKDGLTSGGSPAIWRKGPATPSTDGTVPFDYRYGAGALRIDNSYRILTAGQHVASDSADAPLAGWDYGTVSLNGPQRYFLQVPASELVKTASVTVHWNRKVSGNPGSYGHSLANLNLGLYAASGFTQGVLLDTSVSAIDNIEHIFQRDLAPGRYLLEITSTAVAPWEYAIAWDFRLTPVPPDFNGDHYVDVTDLARLQACTGGPSVAPPPDCADADLDDDNDVDQDDFGLYQRCISGVNVVDPACSP